MKNSSHYLLSLPYSTTRILIADGKGKCLLLCAQLLSYVVNFRYKAKLKKS